MEDYTKHLVGLLMPLAYNSIIMIHTDRHSAKESNHQNQCNSDQQPVLPSSSQQYQFFPP